MPIGHMPAVTSLLLQVAHNGSLGHVANGHDVANGEVCLFAAVHELSSVHALGSNEELLLHLVAVGIPEVSPSKGSTTAGVMDDLLDDSLDVTMPLREVDSSESRL